MDTTDAGDQNKKGLSKLKQSVPEHNGLFLGTAHDFIRFALAQQVLRLANSKPKQGVCRPIFFNAGLFYDGASLAQLANGYADIIDRAHGARFCV